MARRDELERDLRQRGIPTSVTPRRYEIDPDENRENGLSTEMSGIPGAENRGNPRPDAYLDQTNGESTVLGREREERNNGITPFFRGGDPANSSNEPKPVIGKEEIREALETLMKYKADKANLDRRVKEDEDWWRLRQWHYFRDKPMDPASLAHEPMPVSAWLFNSVINKHADMMDNTPEPAILPREESDEMTAKALTNIVPVIMERNNFEDAYSEAAWDKLKNGTGVYGVFWDNDLEDGLGDISVKRLDLLSVYWEPGKKDIQESKNLFITSYWDRESFVETWPDLKEKVKASAFRPEEYNTEDQQRNEDKILVVDWYYKRNYGGKRILHYCKFAGEHVLYASENDENYILTGYYNHGMYPVVFDPMFPQAKSPAGFGYIDIMRSPQEYIDKLDASILKNAMWAARPRYFVSDATNINTEEFADNTKDLISVAGSLDDTRVRPIEVPPLPGAALTVRQMKIDELKETSGNRDFSQGTTTAGVTAASAIAALQEAGSKTSRDLNKATYRAYTKIVSMVIENIRQFYTEQRSFRILGENSVAEYVRFDNRDMQPGEEREEFGEMVSGRRPVFDIKVKAQKSSPFSRLSQNELAIQLFSMGLFNPELTDQALSLIDMMDFEGKDKVRERVSENGDMYRRNQWLQSIAIQAAQALATATGDQTILAALQQQLAGGMAQGAAMPAGGAGGLPETNGYGEPLSDTSTAGKARRTAQEGSEVR